MHSENMAKKLPKMLSNCQNLKRLQGNRGRWERWW